MSSFINRAKCLASMVHIYETRRNGEPYLTHCKNVAESVKNKGEIIESSAYLHDVLENSENPDTIRTLMLDYFPPEISHIVETLTNDKNTQYSRYIEVVCNNKSALLIKFADMIDNTDDIIPEKQFNKYKESCEYMISKGIEIPLILKDRLKL